MPAERRRADTPLKMYWRAVHRVDAANNCGNAEEMHDAIANLFDVTRSLLRRHDNHGDDILRREVCADWGGVVSTALRRAQELVRRRK